MVPLFEEEHLQLHTAGGRHHELMMTCMSPNGARSMSPNGAWSMSPNGACRSMSPYSKADTLDNDSVELMDQLALDIPSAVDGWCTRRSRCLSSVLRASSNASLSTLPQQVSSSTRTEDAATASSTLDTQAPAGQFRQVGLGHAALDIPSSNISGLALVEAVERLGKACNPQLHTLHSLQAMS